MINVAAIRMQQFGVQFYQASLTAGDIDKLVRFEVLSYGDSGQPPVRGGKQRLDAPISKVNWDLLERRIASSEKAYQRQIIRRKIDELVQYYEQCRQARDLPSIPGAVIISCDEKLTFQPASADSRVGILKVPEREGILRAIDGQHRLLALHADIDRFQGEDFSVPAIIFDRLPEDHVVQMFVTINAKHTRLNASHLVSLSGRQLYRDENAGDGARRRAGAQRPRRLAALRRDQAARCRPRARRAGAAGAGAQEAVRLRCVRRAAPMIFTRRRRSSSSTTSSRSRSSSAAPGTAASTAIKSASALRAFVRVAPDVIRRLDQEHADRTDFRAIGRVIAPWGRRIGDLRFETEGVWKRAGTTVDSLVKELRLALQYPEGAAV